MFTVKQVQSTGAEFIWPATTVWFEAANTNPDIREPAVKFSMPDDTMASIGGGKIYVMNANGKTVAYYDLGDRSRGDHGVMPVHRDAA